VRTVWTLGSQRRGPASREHWLLCLIVMLA
jgi:hypothetical protein